MGYTHFKGISLLEEGLAVGQKGQEKRVIDTSGRIATSGLTALVISATDGMIHRGIYAKAVIGSGTYKEMSGEIANIQTANIDDMIATMMSGAKAVIGSTIANNLYVDNTLRLDIEGTIGSSALDHYDGYITVNISGHDRKIPYLD